MKSWLAGDPLAATCKEENHHITIHPRPGTAVPRPLRFSLRPKTAPAPRIFKSMNVDPDMPALLLGIRLCGACCKSLPQWTSNISGLWVLDPLICGKYDGISEDFTFCTWNGSSLLDCHCQETKHPNMVDSPWDFRSSIGKFITCGICSREVICDLGIKGWWFSYNLGIIWWSCPKSSRFNGWFLCQKTDLQILWGALGHYEAALALKPGAGRWGSKMVGLAPFKCPVSSCYQHWLSGWWFGTSILFSQKCWVSNHPNWRTHIFQRGGPTTNQLCTFSWMWEWLCGFCDTRNHGRASFC